MRPLLSSCASLAACGSSGAKPDSTPTLTWYVGPDRADTTALARTCTAAADGAYEIRVKQLPTDVNARHAMLVRRLQAKDTSIDLLSLDSAFTAEFSAAQFLAPLPEELKAAFGKDIAPAALAAATYDGQLAVAPWWFDPQLLWYRGNVAERAGLDTTKPISWDDLVAGAERLGVTIQMADDDGTGLAQWVNALVAGAGGKLIDGTGRDAKVGLDSDAGRAAASVVEFYLDADRGPGPSKDALKKFAAPTAASCSPPARSSPIPTSRPWRPTWRGRPIRRSPTRASRRCQVSASRCRCMRRTPTCPTRRSTA